MGRCFQGKKVSDIAYVLLTNNIVYICDALGTVQNNTRQLRLATMFFVPIHEMLLIIVNLPFTSCMAPEHHFDAMLHAHSVRLLSSYNTICQVRMLTPAHSDFESQDHP
jgi:hypothetical protein